MTKLTRFLATSALALAAATSANAAGFAIQETSGSQLGNAFAGTGAQTSDVSGVWNNPAIAAFMPNGFHASAQVSVILPKAQFNNNGSTGFAANGNDADGGKNAIVPSLYGLWGVNDQFKVGLAVTAPFGLATEYPEDWRGAQKAIKSDLRIINLNPFISFKIHENVSLGVGASFQHADIELTNKISGLMFGIEDAEGRFRAKGDDWGYGFNVGLFINELWQGASFGVHYRSKIKHRLSGNSTVSGLDIDGTVLAGLGLVQVVNGIIADITGQANALGAGATRENVAEFLNLKLGDTSITSTLDTPETVAFYFVQEVMEDFKVMLTAMWTRWTSVQQIRIAAPQNAGNAVANINGINNGVSGKADPQNWSNAWFLSIGGEWKFHEQFTGKLGFAYDQTPTNDLTRSPRLPGNDRYWISAGLDWCPNEDTKVGLGYTHVFIKEATIDNTLVPNNVANALAGGSSLKGTYSSSVDIIGIQGTFRF